MSHLNTLGRAIIKQAVNIENIVIRLLSHWIVK